MSAGHLRAGRQAEQCARRFLKKHGLRFLCANFSCRYGELDLVMLDRNCLVIVEVRYRRSRGYGGAIATVSAAKRERIRRATEKFLQSEPGLRHLALRFDVVALSGPLRSPALEWRRQAFAFDDE